MGIINASFHSSGRTPEERDLLNSLHTEGASSDEHSTKMRVAGLSGREALLTFKPRSNNSTSETVNEMEDSVASDFDRISVIGFSQDGGSGEYTFKKYLLNPSA